MKKRLLIEITVLREISYLMLTNILIDQLDIIFFIYGLAHIIPGLAIFIQLRITEKSNFRLLEILPTLGLFELTHGIHEFTDMFKLIKGDDVLALQIIGSVMLMISYFYILLFGYRLINLNHKRLGAWFLILAIAGYLVFPLYHGLSANNFSISARYFFGFPGAVLSAIGLIRYYQGEQKKLSQLRVKPFFYVAALFFGIYGVLGGLVVRPAEFFPANIFNNDWFLSLARAPIQLFRAICAIAIAASILRIIDIFNFEHHENSRRAQALIRDSEHRYRTIIDNSNDLIWMNDANGIVTYFNKRAKEKTGRKLNKRQGKSYEEYVAPGYLDKANRLFDELMSGRRVNDELGVLTKDGSVIILYVNAVPLYERGKVVGIVSFGKDITNLKDAEKNLQEAYNALENKVAERTSELQASNDLLKYEIAERKAVEKALKEAHKRFVTIMDSLDALVYVADMQTYEVLFINKYGRDIFGDITGKLCWQYIQTGKKNPCEFCTNDKLVDSKGKPKGVISWTFQNTQNNNWYDIRDRAIRWIDGQLVRLEIAMDITERRQAEDLIRQTNEKFKAAFDNAPIGMTLASATGEFLQVNKAVCDFFGYSEEELLSKRVEDVSHSDDMLVNLKFRQDMADGKTEFFQMEKRYYHKDGRIIWGQLSVSTVRSKGGEPYFLITHLQDITERKRAMQLGESLHDINQAINSTLNFETIMSRVITKATEAMGCSTTSVILEEKGSYAIRYSHGLKISTQKPLSPEEVSVFVPKEDIPLIINDAEKEAGIDQAIAKKYSTRAFLSVPLTFKDEQRGSIVFHYKDKPANFIQADMDFAQKLTMSVSAAIDNAKKYEVEHMIADTLQKSLLTVPEKIKGIEFSHMYNSATEAAMVGGDFYDIFDLEDNKVAIMVGDVSGKGVEAASFTSLVKNTVKAYAYHETSPAIVMSKANDIIIKSSPANIFVSMFFGILDKATGLITYCNAGHPAALIKRENGDIAMLENTSTVLGVMEQECECEQSTLGKKDLMVIYTDGLTEARNKKDFFTEEKLLDIIDRSTADKPRKLAQTIFQEVLSFSNGTLSDDIVLMVLSLSDKSTIKFAEEPAYDTNLLL